MQNVTSHMHDSEHKTSGTTQRTRCPKFAFGKSSQHTCVTPACQIDVSVQGLLCENLALKWVACMATQQYTTVVATQHHNYVAAISLHGLPLYIPELI